MLPLQSACLVGDGTIETIGRILAAAVLHGGHSLQFLNPVIAELLIDEKPKLSVNMIPNVEKRECVQKVMNGIDTTSEPIFQDVAEEIGWRKELTQLNRPSFVSAACQHYVLFHQQAAITSLVKGMQFYGMGDYSKSYPDCIRSIIGSPMLEHFNADNVFDLFTIEYSEQGTNNREKEEATTMFFIEFLEKCNANDADVDSLSLGDFLEFFTGSRRPVLGGYHVQPKITFSDDMLPVASTCAFSIVLPRGHTTADEFSSLMVYAIRNSFGFGVV
ncbi:uncharacterized protein LOC117101614 [Anneissia japonica]|uniref:uncharacterized protein LOC117101614 n=1 Tax=Anneissia japonica TaxID=1529436 RepID=UPI001425ADF5|nr:uncharacterized protein LOC117101614 [Anneissia japonica]